MLSMEMNHELGVASAPIEAKKNEFYPYQDNGGYESRFII
jgi:hypothetical protein